MATRRTRQQLQFTGFEMAMLALSFVITATCVFFLGFYVGKKNAALHAPQEDRIARIPVDDFSKYARPAIPADPSAPAKKHEPKPDDEADAKAVVVAKGEQAKAAEAGADAAGEKRRKKVDAVVSPSADDAADDQDIAAVAPRKAKDADKPADTDADADAADDEEEEPARGTPGYTVQVLATRKEADAEALIKKLKSRGYEAYVKRVSDGQTSWYRVRVGRYGGFGDARAMADRCRRELGLEQAFVSTE